MREAGPSVDNAPLRSIPAARTSLIGGEDALATLRRTLLSPSLRVLTITGPRRAPVDVWFDADDGDVSVIGDVSVPDWSLHDAEAESACLAASGQLLHDLAAGTCTITIDTYRQLGAWRT